MRTELWKSGACGIAIVVATALAVPTHAQERETNSQQEADDGSDDRPQSGEIVVTGQKRETTAKDLPATVSVLDSDMLSSARVVDIQGLTQVVSGFGFEKSSGGNMTVSMRGIGTASSATSLEQSVAPYTEGVYQGGTLRGFSWPVFDVERIEVFKGTQSGLVGQNTSIGAINIVPTQPGSSLTGYVTGGYEFENDGYIFEGGVSIPVSRDFSVRLSGHHQRIGGWVHNAATGNDVGQLTRSAARILGVWDDGGAARVKLYGEYSKIRQIGTPVVWFADTTGAYANYVAPFFEFVSPNGDGEGYTNTSAHFDRRARNDGDADVDADNIRGSLTVDVDVGAGITLTSITSGMKENDSLSVDQDYLPASTPPTSPTGQVSQYLTHGGTYDQFTQEVRLATSPDADVSFIGGLWYRHAVSDKEFVFYRDRFGATDVANIPSRFVTDNFSAFGDVQAKLFDNLTIGGSLRYTAETKTATLSATSTWPSIFLPFEEKTEKLTPNFLDGSARILYELSPSINVYALFSHGTKTGSVVDIVGGATLQILKPEKARTLEAGVKGAFNRGSFDVGVFNLKVTDYQDVQTLVQNGLVIFAGTNTDIEISGVDFQGRVEPFDGFELGVNGEWLFDAKDLTNGGRNIRSPDWSFIADARYTLPTSVFGGDLALFGSVQYKSTYFNQLNGNPSRPLSITPEFTKLNVGIDYTTKSGFKLSLVCRNCNNAYELARTAVTNVSGSPARYAYIPELRTISLQATFEY